MLGSGGLKAVTRPDLLRLLREVHHGRLPCPIDNIGLAATGLLRLGDDLDILRKLEKPGVVAVLTAVIYERR